MGFLTGSMKELEKVAESMIAATPCTNLSVSDHWMEFLTTTPDNDDLQSYILREGIGERECISHSLLEELFNGVPFDKAVVPSLLTKNDMKVRKTAPLLVWSGRTDYDKARAKQRLKNHEKTRLAINGQESPDDDDNENSPCHYGDERDKRDYQYGDEKEGERHFARVIGFNEPYWRVEY